MKITDLRRGGESAIDPLRAGVRSDDVESISLTDTRTSAHGHDDRGGNMTKTHFVILMAAFTITQAGTSWVMQNVVPTKWEYRTAYMTPGEEGYYYGGDLKKLGQDKWELISVLPDKTGRKICFFKRPVVK